MLLTKSVVIFFVLTISTPLISGSRKTGQAIMACDWDDREKYFDDSDEDSSEESEEDTKPKALPAYQPPAYQPPINIYNSPTYQPNDHTKQRPADNLINNNNNNDNNNNLFNQQPAHGAAIGSTYDEVWCYHGSPPMCYGPNGAFDLLYNYPTYPAPYPYTVNRNPSPCLNSQDGSCKYSGLGNLGIYNGKVTSGNGAVTIKSNQGWTPYQNSG